MTLAHAKLQPIVWTSRMAEARRFYGDILGLPLVGESHGAAVFRVGETDLRVAPVPATEPSAHTVLGFAVDDLRTTAASLAARGVKFEQIPGFRHDALGIVETPEGAAVAWFRDPDGNLLSIVQYRSHS